MHRLALLEKGEDKSVELATAAAEEAWRQDIERSMRSDEGSGDLPRFDMGSTMAPKAINTTPSRGRDA